MDHARRSRCIAEGISSPKSSRDLAALYNKKYFLEHCEGCLTSHAFDGTNPPLRLKISFEKANPKKGERMLDLGSGRGELVFYAAYHGLQALGVDYSQEAIAFSEELKQRLPFPECQNASFRWTQDWAKEFEPESFDIIYFCDLVEHVYPHELDEMLKVAYQYLSPGGRIVVHTHPNRFIGGLTQRFIKNPFMQATIFKWYAWFLGMKSLFVDVGEVHVNEQSVGSLKAVLAKTPFQFKVWSEHFISPEQKKDPRTLMRKIIFFGWPLTAVWPLNLIFANDIWAVGVKPVKKEKTF